MTKSSFILRKALLQKATIPTELTLKLSFLKGHFRIAFILLNLLFSHLFAVCEILSYCFMKWVNCYYLF